MTTRALVLLASALRQFLAEEAYAQQTKKRIETLAQAGLTFEAKSFEVEHS